METLEITEIVEIPYTTELAEITETETVLREITVILVYHLIITTLIQKVIMITTTTITIVQKTI